MKLGGRGKRKENDKASVIDENIRTVKVEDIRICTESCEKWGVGGKLIRDSN
jgi:hypothetical protein